MRIKLIAGLAIFGWQLLALLLNVIGQSDVILSALPDPNWYVAVLAVVMKPPTWLAVAAAASVLWLFTWAWFDYRQRHGGHG
jgi:hypothetical protein